MKGRTAYSSLTDDRPAALVLGLSPTGLAAIRSLGRRGITVYGVGNGRMAAGRFSRYCKYLKDLSQVSMMGDRYAFFQALVRLGEQSQRPIVIFATSDQYIESLAPLAHRLPEVYRFSTDLATFGLQFLDKTAFYRLCSSNGVELPQTFFPSGREDLAELSRNVDYPVIVKPARIHRFRAALHARKVLHAADRHELQAAYDQLARVDRDLIVQEVVPGGDDSLWCALCYLDAASRPTAVLVSHKLRQFPPHFGSACLIESRANEEVAQLSLGFLKRIGFRGICATEFKRDPRDGRFKMIEVNARLPLWAALGPAAGVDVVYASYQDLVGGSTAMPQRQVDGVRWTFAVKDVVSAGHYLRRRELSGAEWWRSVSGRRIGAIAVLDDPAPAMWHLLYMALGAPGRVLRAVRRRVPWLEP